MCLSTVYNDSGEGQEEIMREVSQMEAKDDGFVLINLFGEQEFVRGKIKSIDFIDEHSVVLEKNANK
jgi:predicted RNA-binding protein